MCNPLRLRIPVCMRKFLLISILFTGIKSYAQFDTSHINRVFEYILSDKFRQEYSDSLTADYKWRDSRMSKKKYLRRFKRYLANEWATLQNACFISPSLYFIPDTPRKSTIDTFMVLPYPFSNEFKKGGEFTRRIYCPFSAIHKDSLKLACHFLSPDIIALSYFLGQSPFGVACSLSFSINPDMTVTFIRRDKIICN